MTAAILKNEIDEDSKVEEEQAAFSKPVVGGVGVIDEERGADGDLSERSKSARGKVKERVIQHAEGV